MKNLFFACTSWCLLFLFFTPFAFSQNVGIGTTAPAFKLDVKNGSINTDSVYRIGGEKVLSVNLQNTFVGISAANSITTGNYNTANGYEVLYYNTTGENNTALGYHTLLFNTTGDGNTANGYEALNRNIIGTDNVALGSQSLLFNTSGIRNTATGNQALFSNTNGDFNTANGNQALYFNTIGAINAAFGSNALNSNTTGNFNTGVGANADVITGGLSNSTALGYNARVDASNKVRIGNTQVTSIGGNVGWSTFSDGRYKQNILEDVPGIAFINKLRPVTYTVDVKSLDENYYKLKPGVAAAANTSFRHTGFIAQEVEQSATALGFTFSGVDKPQQADRLYGLRYAEFVVPLVKAVQEQQQQIQDLKKEINILKEIIKNK